MKIAKAFVLSGIFSFLAADSAHCQPAACVIPPGMICDHPNGTTGSQFSFPWQDHFTALTRLGFHWMPSFGDGDSMSRPFWLDQGTSFPFGSQGLQESWYISRDSIPATGPFYSLLNQTSDHMDSPLSTEGSYTADLGAPHGYPWLSDQGGMAPIQRYFSQAFTDHRTEPNSIAPPTPNSDYNPDPAYAPLAAAMPRYGYQRYGNFLDQCCTIQRGDDLGPKMQNSKLRVGLNRIMGNAISELTYLPTGQQLVKKGIGELLQSVLWYSGAQVNPTQSGGADCGDYGATRRYAGSPVIFQSSILGSAPTYVTSIVRPLSFCHAQYVGTNPWSPLAWRGLFRVTSVLGCNLNGTLYEDVFQVEDEARKDYDAAFTNNPILMNNVAWLQTGPLGDCRTQSLAVDLVDVTTGTSPQSWSLNCVPPNPTQTCSSGSPCCNGVCTFPAPFNKGLMITSSSGLLAIGLVHLEQPTLSDSYSFKLGCNFGCDVPNQTAIMSAEFFHNIVNTNWERENVFWIVGTPSDVKARMKNIYDGHGQCRGNFYPVAPCRLYDSRTTSSGLISGEERTMKIVGTCGLPDSARAVAFNLTAVNPPGDGSIVMYPDPGHGTQTITLAFLANHTRANNSVMSLALAGAGTVSLKHTMVATGKLDILLDVSGYFD